MIELRKVKWVCQNHEKLKNCGNFLPLSNIDHPDVLINGYYMYVVHDQIRFGVCIISYIHVVITTADLTQDKIHFILHIM